eukprot:14043358-Alexandrium_andersonii.AAC.1
MTEGMPASPGGAPTACNCADPRKTPKELTTHPPLPNITLELSPVSIHSLAQVQDGSHEREASCVFGARNAPLGAAEGRLSYE